MAGENEEAGLTAEALRNLAESADKQRIATALQIELMHKMATEMGLNTGKLKSGNSALEDFITETRAATEAEKANAEALEKEQKALANLTAAGNKAGEGLGLFAKGLFTAGGDMTKYSGAVDSMGDAAFSAGKAFGPLGMAIGGAVKALTMLFGAVMEQNKNMLNAADSLSKIGATGDLTTTQIREMGARAGYSSDQLDKFVAPIKKLGPAIIGLGVSATDGAKAMGQLMEMDETVLAGFRNLGVSQEELNANQADYIRLQIMSGQQITERSKQDGSLRKASIEYTNNLLELSALSGEDVESIKKKQEMNRADLAVATRLAIMQDKEEALRAKAAKATDKGIQDDLNRQADKIGKESKNMRALQDVASTMGMSQKEMAGFNSMLATGNFNELSKGFAAGVPGILEFMKAVKEGKKSPEELRIFMAEATKRTRDAMGEAIIQNKDIGDSVAYSSGLIENEAKFRGKSLEEMQAIVEKEKADRAKTASGVGDDAKNARNAQETTERRMRLAKDEFVGMIQGPFTKAFEYVQKMMGEFAKWIAGMLDKFTGSHFSDMFKTPEEIQREQEETAKEIATVNAKIAESSQSLGDPKKAVEDARKVKEQHENEYTDNERHIEELKKQRDKETDSAKKKLLSDQIYESRQKSNEINRQVTMDRQKVIENQKLASEGGKQRAEEKLANLRKQQAELQEKAGQQEKAFKDAGGKAAVKPGDSPEAAVSALKGPQKEFYDKMYATLLEEAKKQKLANPEAIARLGAAQSSQETGYGKATAGGNNFFGIKAKPGDKNASMVDTQEYDAKQGKMVTTKAGFRKYDSMNESAADYIKFLQENKNYKGVLEAKTAEEAIAAQGKSGYATDPAYAKSLAKINASAQTPASRPAGQLPTQVASAAPDMSNYKSRAETGSAEQLKQAGLKIKKGDVQKDGSALNPKLIEIAQNVQAGIPGFSQFTGFNDVFHQEKAPKSQHAKGLAFDFVLDKPPSKEEGRKLVAMLQSMGLDYVQDEYNNPSPGATAGHMHGQLKAYDGGVFEGISKMLGSVMNGPASGYQVKTPGGKDVEMHNREAIVPLQNKNDRIQILKGGVTKSPLSDVLVSDKSTTSKNKLGLESNDSTNQQLFMKYKNLVDTQTINLSKVTSATDNNKQAGMISSKITALPDASQKFKEISKNDENTTEEKQATIPPVGAVATPNDNQNNENLVAVMENIQQILLTKFDDMIDALNDGNSTSKKLLNVSRV